MPAELHGIKAADVHAKIKLLINGLVNITDTIGEFLMTLADGRVIDTKGWNDWVSRRRCIKFGHHSSAQQLSLTKPGMDTRYRPARLVAVL